MLLLAILLTAAQAAPTPEAEALGRRIAETGTLGTLLPLLTAKDTDDLVAQHPELSDADRAELRRAAAATLAAAEAKLFGAEAKAYAAALTLPELKAIVAWQTGPIATRLRAAQPAAIGAAVAAAQGFDFKKAVWAAFCAGEAKRCAPE